MNDQLKLDSKKSGNQVECLGLLFPDEDARREHFLKELAEKLKEPAFRNQEGFPQGTDDAILAMSDPPYYTACPNPWLEDFLRHYGNSYDPDQEYSREPMAIDVSVGKTDRIYKAHSYHTKIPHMAIVPSILHYTEPGDVIFDGFSGSGMTGVATQWCELASASDRKKIELELKKLGLSSPRWGKRRAILNDLSPAATFIGANYNIPFSVNDFALAGKELLEEVGKEIGWMYETLHTDGKTIGRIEYTVWSECFACQACGGEILFTDSSLKQEKKYKLITCTQCGSESRKEGMDLVFESYFNQEKNEIEKRPKRVPVAIEYKIEGKKYRKVPDTQDLENIRLISDLTLPSEFPLNDLGDSQMTRVGRMKTTKTTTVRDMFLPRAAQAIGLMWRIANRHDSQRIRNALLFFVEQSLWTMSTCNTYRPSGYSQVSQYMNGVYYIPSQHAELSPWYVLGGKLHRLIKAFMTLNTKMKNIILSTGTAYKIAIPDNCIDYIFTDPPFGENIYYADLNVFVESWHGVITDSLPEAIIDRVKSKTLPDYQHLMHKCFSEFYRVLKPGRWMTVVFSNSRAAVWNSIQVGLQQAGFVVAEVTALDKIQGSRRQVTATTAVKQDLVISVYKPNGGLEERLKKRGAVFDSAWDFVESHLSNLALAKSKDGILEMVVERDPRRIFDRMVAWFVRHDLPVPLSTGEFLEELRKRYYERDGMIFLSGQVEEYDRKRAVAVQPPQIELFVLDERSAIDWLMDFLRKRPSTYQDLHPEFMVQIGAGWKKHEIKPELTDLLESNFLRYDGKSDVPNQIHSYLSTNYKDMRGLRKNDPLLIAKARDRWYVPDPSKAKDLDQRREKSLLREFESYKTATKSQLRESRLEVLRAGFKAAWEANDYYTIIRIAEKLPEETLQEDEQLLLWYDQSLTRTEGDA